MARYQPTTNLRNFDAIRIKLASPEKIIEWARPPKPNPFTTGEVKKPETINYRTFRPERDGLFCEAIFGPTKDYECACGKYKRIKYKGTVCERCGVEVTQSKVRRERMGYIRLATPVSHIWFFKGVPSHLGLLLDLSMKELERVLYYEAYLVLDPGDSPCEFKDRLTEDQYQELIERGYHFRAEMGAAAIKEVLVNMDLEKEAQLLEQELAETNSKQKAKKIRKRLRLIRGLQRSENRPEWMILDVIPVMPPELRPLVALDGGRFATSDLNDLYRRVINRNNRLKKLVDLRAPEVIIRNEKRMLQEAVDALIENGKHGRVVKGPGNRALKSLSDMLKGKPGRFRQNLLGKRVDYSGRAVIVVGPELQLNQCGLPKKMALELFRPFIIRKLQEKNYAQTIKSAKRMTERLDDQVWEVLEEVIQEHPILLNRAPTLHRLGIQAFQPHLVEGEAIRIHPLVCKAYNADFDGDQMAVHVPLSPEAQIEAQLLMPSIRNLLKPAHGRPVAVPELDMVLGCNYLTKGIHRSGPYKVTTGGHILLEPEEERPPLEFACPEDALYAHEAGYVQLHDWVDVRIVHEGKPYILRTTPGRVLFNEILPKELLFETTDRDGNRIRVPFLNEEVKTRELRNLVSTVYQQLGNRRAVEFLQDLKTIGFRYATISGLSLAASDFVEPANKDQLIAEARKQVATIEAEYAEGRISAGERYNRIVAVWSKLTEDVQNSLFETLAKSTLEIVPALQDTQRAAQEGKSGLPTPAPEALSELSQVGELYERGFNPVYIMADSGARAKKEPMRQISGMRGLMAKPDGSIIETPIFASFRRGLTVLEYFISTHGARKGLADTAIKTASSGYLTRKLVDVAQDVIISMEDCGTIHGITKTAMEAEEEGVPFAEIIEGRVALEEVVDPSTGEVIVRADELITPELAIAIDEAGVSTVTIRSPLTCEASWGVCRKCYGMDLTTLQMVDIGEAIGIIAAQSIGEPGTQLTMRTFHTGGAVSETTSAETRAEARARHGYVHFRNLEVIERPDGSEVALRNGVLVVINDEGVEQERRRVPAGAIVYVRDGQEVTRGTTLFTFATDHVPILTKVGGVVRFRDVIPGQTLEELIDETTGKSERVITEYRDVMPTIDILSPEDSEQVLASYALPAGVRLSVREGDQVLPGDTLARMPRETAKTSDIVTGLPRVTELFEARKPKDHATITEISGVVSFQGTSRGMQVVRVTPEVGEPKDYKIPLGKFVIVQEGDYVEAGDPLTDGSLNPHDILEVKGKDEVQRYLVKEVKEVYRRQGEDINDKHIEVIIRQMMKKVRITDPGDTDFLEGDEVSLNTFRARNRAVQRRMVEREVTLQLDEYNPETDGEAVLADAVLVDNEVLADVGTPLTPELVATLRERKVFTVNARVRRPGRPAEAKPILQGITKAALSTESFISSASFQQTTSVLTKAAALGKRDTLRGLKENVIVGRLIPAGTGTPEHRRVTVQVRPLAQPAQPLEAPAEDDD